MSSLESASGQILQVIFAPLGCLAERRLVKTVGLPWDSLLYCCCFEALEWDPLPTSHPPMPESQVGCFSIASTELSQREFFKDSRRTHWTENSSWSSANMSLSSDSTISGKSLTRMAKTVLPSGSFFALSYGRVKSELLSIGGRKSVSSQISRVTETPPDRCLQV